MNKDKNSQTFFYVSDTGRIFMISCYVYYKKCVKKYYLDDLLVYWEKETDGHFIDAINNTHCYSPFSFTKNNEVITKLFHMYDGVVGSSITISNNSFYTYNYWTDRFRQLLDDDILFHPPTKPERECKSRYYSPAFFK